MVGKENQLQGVKNKFVPALGNIIRRLSDLSDVVFKSFLEVIYNY